ncbi:hypothetical protein B0H15DRAFT_949248 [Mycena belliarum]|uniref:DUF4336 domain-containing protein n=1 Tax=Mycena belliarum TaxID=1033014 RepID=A0AAD6U8X2_9AGAR|nr:hypothetical protein B0H15DRAFT_949248 [Mycena belliae]
MADTTVIREPGCDEFRRPMTILRVLSIGGRSTAIKLASGGVWVLASTPLTPATKAKLDELGPVQYIVAPNIFHHLFLGEFKKAYPAAKLLAPEGTIARADKALVFDGVWGRESEPDPKFGFEDEITACYFSGSKNKDVAFFHPASKTIIEADLIFNLPCTEQYSKTTSSGRIPLPGLGRVTPSSWLHSKISASMGVDKAAMARDAATVAEWDAARLVPCHGDVIETGAKEAWRAAYKAYLPPA